MQNLWKKVGRCIYYQRRTMSFSGLAGRKQLLNRSLNKRMTTQRTFRLFVKYKAIQSPNVEFKLKTF